MKENTSHRECFTVELGLDVRASVRYLGVSKIDRGHSGGPTSRRSRTLSRRAG